MTSISINPKNPTFPPQLYHSMLQESTHHFLSQIQNGNYDFTHFNSLFSRIISTMPSPPIEVIWFYSAINFNTHKNLINKDDNFSLILCFKELFQLLVTCLGPCCSSFKRIALMAPLVFELYSFVCELKLSGSSSDNAVVIREVVCLVDRLVSFISLCCFEEVDDHDDSLALSPCFVDLVKVWTVGRRGRDFKFEDDFRMFFPIVSDEVCDRLFVGTGVGVLAGIVMFETFLLSLLLKFGSEEPSKKLEDDLLSCAVNTITGFRSCYFFDTLLKVLLGSSLPGSPLLTATNEVRLREVLFDAVVSVDYPFFNPGCRIHLCSLHLSSLALTWLFTADKAMQFVRNNGDQTRAISYQKAFSISLIKSQLLRWICNQVGIPEDANAPDLSSPAVFVEWLVQLRTRASVNFDSELRTLLDKATHYKSEMKSELPFSGADGCNEDFHIDQKMGENGEDHANIEMIDSIDVTNSCCNSDLATIEECKKRKGGNNEDSVRVKLFKYHSHGSPIKKFSPFQNELGLIRRN